MTEDAEILRRQTAWDRFMEARREARRIAEQTVKPPTIIIDWSPAEVLISADGVPILSYPADEDPKKYDGILPGWTLGLKPDEEES